MFICNITGHIYIGSAKNLSKRISQHLSGLRSNVPLLEVLRNTVLIILP